MTERKLPESLARRLQEKEKHTNPAQEKKVYPFLFLCALALVFFLGVHFWTDWQAKNEARRIEEIVQSKDIANLILGEGFNKKEFSEKLENMKKAHTKERSLKNKELEAVMLSFANILDFESDDVGLAMQGINVSSGTAGTEEWALFAKWATMRQKTAVLQVENPFMWHKTGKIEKNSADVSTIENPRLLQDDREKVTIEARHGLVYENNTKVLLQDNVIASQLKSSVQGEILSYDSKERVAVFPERASFQGEGLAGKANVLSWNMIENKIYGSGKVYVVWMPSQADKGQDRQGG